MNAFTVLMLSHVVYFSLDNVQLRFRDALKQVYDTKMFSAHDRSMNYELEYGNSHMERAVGFLFHKRSICAFISYIQYICYDAN
jgi:hypothetical protein